MKTITILAFILASSVQADSLYLGAWSDHPFSNDEYNESHDFVGVEHGKMFGAYFRNSYNRNSLAVGYNVAQAQWGDFQGKVMAGVVVGYRGCYKDSEPDVTPCPLLVPMVSYTRYRVQPTLIVMGEALAISVRFEL